MHNVVMAAATAAVARRWRHWLWLVFLQVVITTGTFLRGMVHIGKVKYPAGRHLRDRCVQRRSHPWLCMCSPCVVVRVAGVVSCRVMSCRAHTSPLYRRGTPRPLILPGVSSDVSLRFRVSPRVHVCLCCRRHCSAGVEPPSIGLSATLERCGFPLSRLTTGASTALYTSLLSPVLLSHCWGVWCEQCRVALSAGTPPRLDSRSIDYSNLEEQRSDDPPVAFSYMNDCEEVANKDRLICCHLTATTAATHELIKKHMHLLPTFEVSESSPVESESLCVERKGEGGRSSNCGEIVDASLAVVGAGQRGQRAGSEVLPRHRKESVSVCRQGVRRVLLPSSHRRIPPRVSLLTANITYLRRLVIRSGWSPRASTPSRCIPTD
jgi:hypothetical protein